MKKPFYLLVIVLFFGVNYLPAQKKSSDKCGIAQPQLKDGKMYTKAKKCKNNIEPKFVKQQKDVSLLPSPVKVAHLHSSCGSFNINDTNWVVLLEELEKVYNERLTEFARVQNRLEKLLGVEADGYDCLVVFEVPPSLLRKPDEKDGDDDFPFTGKGFTCDWFYGDGCRYGLSEFIIDKSKEKNPNKKEITRYEINNQCTVQNSFLNKCETVLLVK
jgi:hypothetical protein